jgi:hypothetical protein
MFWLVCHLEYMESLIEVVDYYLSLLGAKCSLGVVTVLVRHSSLTIFFAYTETHMWIMTDKCCSEYLELRIYEFKNTLLELVSYVYEIYVDVFCLDLEIVHSW